jgi:hypothetical protein
MDYGLPGEQNLTTMTAGPRRSARNGALDLDCV